MRRKGESTGLRTINARKKVLVAKSVLRAENLTKRYGTFLAVDKISFALKEGEILGLLGPNGAGKTTTIDMLLGLTLPTQGKISYFGKEFTANREWILGRVNFASAYNYLQGRMTVRQNLRIFGGLYEVANLTQRMAELAALLGIEDLMDRLYWHLSNGEKTRVNLAKALLNSPQILLMDEPTASLDPEIAQKVVETIATLRNKQGVSILYTSHNMAEVARLCDRVIFLDKGTILAVDTPLGLTKIVGEAKLLVTFDGKQTPVSTYLDEMKYDYQYLREHLVEVSLPEKSIPKTLFGLSAKGVWLTDIDIHKPTLEDVFLSITKGGRRALAQS